MRDATIQAVVDLFGAPDPSINDNIKVHRWHIREGLDIVVQRDASPQQGKVWVPANNIIDLPSFAEPYPVGKGRHSGTLHSACPSLADGCPVFCLTVTERGQLSELARFLKSLGRDRGVLAKRESSTQLSEAFGAVIKILSFGKYVPGLGSVLGPVGEVASKTVDWLDKREKTRKAQRLEQIVMALVPRMASFERATATEEQVDLFLEVLTGALADDEEKKAPLYAALLAWIVEQPREPEEVRMLAEILQRSSYFELWAHQQMIKADRFLTPEGAAKADLGREPVRVPQVFLYLDLTSFRDRLVDVGLAANAPSSRGHGSSRMGERLQSIVGTMAEP